MKRVCHVASLHNAEDTRIFHKECCTLATEGYEVFLVQRGKSYDKNGVHIIGTGDNSKSKKSQLFSDVNKACNAALETNAEIIHLHESAMLRWVKKFKRKGKIVIYDSHEFTAGSILDKSYIPIFLRKPISKIYSIYEKRICHKLDAIIAATPQVVDYFSGVSKNIVLVTNYPIYDEKLEISSFDKKSIIYAGGITRQYNVDQIVDAISKINGCKLVLCGSCDEKYLSEMRSKDSWKCVDYLGRIEHSLLSKKMTESSAGMAILTPSNNTFGKEGTLSNTKIFEIMMSGLPVICSDFKYWREIIEKHKCGILVGFNDQEKLQKAISYIIENLDEAKTMGINGRNAIKEEFNWENEGKKLCELYANLCK